MNDVVLLAVSGQASGCPVFHRLFFWFKTTYLSILVKTRSYDFQTVKIEQAIVIKAFYFRK